MSVPQAGRSHPHADKAEIVVVGEDLATVIALASEVERAGSRVTALHRSDVTAAAFRALVRKPRTLLVVTPGFSESAAARMTREAANTTIAFVDVRSVRPLRARVTYSAPGKDLLEADLRTFLRLDAARRTTTSAHLCNETPTTISHGSDPKPTGVLLVEDDAAIADVLERALAARGWSVRIAPTGEDALAVIGRELPELLLLDINLPDITGWEVLRRLDEGQRATMPVIVYSASPLSQPRVKEFRPAGVLSKPFPVSALVRLVHELTGSRRGKEVIADA